MTPDFSDLSGKICAVTGGAGVLGEVFCEALAAAGVRVCILDLDGDKAVARAQALTQRGGPPALGLGCDVLDADSVEAARAAIRDAFGPLNLLVNAAGGNSAGATTDAEQIDRDPLHVIRDFFDLDIETFRRNFDLNLLGTVLPSQILGRDLVEAGGGAMVNISSMSAYRPLTRIPAYSMAKSGISNFTQWLAVHLAPAGVRVNAIAPGFFLTEQLRFLAYDEAGELTPRYERVLAHTPMHRFGEPDELVGALLYLLSDLGRFVTGVVIPVDGGFNAYSGV